MSDESFKVIDKRRFNDPASQDAETKDQASETKTEPEPVTASEPAEPPSNTHSTDSPQAIGRDSSIDFSSFVVSMATQGLMMLGEVPHPETGESILSLEAAKQTIDILSVIEDKTQGNLTKDEERLLGEVIASLRLSYVSKSGSK